MGRRPPQPPSYMAEVERVVGEEWSDAYLSELDALHREMVLLNAYMFVLSKLADFRFDLFGRGNNRFWNLVFASMSESYITIMYRTCVDTNPDVLTLAHLKNAIVDHIINDEFKTEFIANTRSKKFTRTIRDVGERITRIRNNYVAHFNRACNVEPTREQRQERMIMVSELEEMVTIVNELFQVLCIGHGRSMSYLEYGDEVRKSASTDARSDLQQLLDRLARDSACINMPEQQPEYWPLHKDNLAADDLEVINQYRAKFGLQPV